MQIYGDTSGLKKNQLRQLDKLLQRSVPADSFVSPSLAEELSECSLQWRQPLSVLIDRKGRLVSIYVGTPAELGEDPNGPFEDASERQLSELRLIHTQLEAMEPPSRFEETTLLQYRLDALVTLCATMHPSWSQQFGTHPKVCDQIYFTAMTYLHDEQALSTHHEGPYTLYQAEEQSFQAFLELLQADLAPLERRTTKTKLQERAFLIGQAKSTQRDAAQDTLGELAQLARTAGAEVVGKVLQVRQQPDPNFYIGKGKAYEMAYDLQQAEVDLVICDDELSPAQQRHLETVLRTRVIDRTQLILDIFAQRAQSYEGQLQVELAQLQYMLPRLAGKGSRFSQQTAAGKGSGTIATRGPGETKLELDRRRIRQRVQDLEQQAKAIRRHRQTQRQARQAQGIPVVALVGYTNAGKSTLLNTLTKAGVLSEDKLFATLDTTTRKLVRPDMLPCLLIDTVGFIQKLPTALVKAFRSTLEELDTADVLWHVVDMSHPNRQQQIESVQETLSLLELDEKPQWILLNKMDRLANPDEECKVLSYLEARYPLYTISAQSGEGLDTVLSDLTHMFLTEPATVIPQS